MSKRTITAISVILINTSGCGLFYDFSGYRLVDDSSDGAPSDSNINQTDSTIETTQIDSGTDTILQNDSATDIIQSEPTTDTYICNPVNCNQPEHGTAICTNNQCDVQCLVGCTKNGLSCDCPKPECCYDPNHQYDNPQCAGKQYQSCVYGVCQGDGFNVDVNSCTAYCTTCKNKEFDQVIIDVQGPPTIYQCECKP